MTRPSNENARSMVQAVVLLLFGVALLRLATSDELLRYVRPAARLWVGLAGAGLALLAGWTLIALFRRTNPEAEPELAAGQWDEHGHPASTPAMWLILAPVVAVLAVAPPALGSFSASRAPTVQPAAARPPKLRTGSGPVSLSLFDFLVLSDARPVALRAQPVTLTGFVLADRAGGFTLARLVITCCAADASTARVDVGYPGPVPARGSWLQVTGTFTGSDPDADHTPRLAAGSLTSVSEPANPYDH